MSEVNQIREMPEPEVAIERILLLETSNVGCQMGCLCRGLLAMTLTEEEATKLKHHTTNVTFDKIPSNESIVKEALGLKGEAAELIEHIEADRARKNPESVAGGRQLAEEIVMFVELQLLVDTFAGATVPTPRH